MFYERDAAHYVMLGLGVHYCLVFVGGANASPLGALSVLCVAIMDCFGSKPHFVAGRWVGGWLKSKEPPSLSSTFFSWKVAYISASIIAVPNCGPPFAAFRTLSAHEPGGACVSMCVCVHACVCGGAGHTADRHYVCVGGGAAWCISQAAACFGIGNPWPPRHFMNLCLEVQGRTL